MLSTYNIICIPVDTDHPVNSPTSFSLVLVAELQFPAGVAQTPDSIREIVKQHPLLAIPQAQPLRALVMDYKHWAMNKRMDPSVAVPVALQFEGAIPQSQLLINIGQYLEPSTSITPGPLKHDASYERLDENHFIDVNKAADDLRSVKRRLLQDSFRQSGSLNVGRPIPQVKAGSDLSQLTARAVKLARWVDVASHTTVLNAVTERDGDRREVLYKAFGEQASTLRDLHGAVEKLRTRAQSSKLTSCNVSTTDHLSGVDGSGNSYDMSADDPQVAIHAALKNNLIAERCGFVTRWKATAARSLPGPQCYAIQVDLASLTHRQSVAITAQTTAFSRATHTHPISYRDIESTQPSNGVLAALNEPDGSVRYHATSVNAETHILKETVVQSGNSLGGPSNAKGDDFGNFQGSLDDRPPQVFRQNQYGSAEPETSGVMFSAPVEDLLTPSDLRFDTPEKRTAQLPCLFLEDLWVGYRLDLRNSRRTEFSSIHKKIVSVKFPGVSDPFEGEMEDFLEREQRDDATLVNSSTDLTTYVGMNAGQTAQLRVLLGLPPTEAARQTRPFYLFPVKYGQSERLLFEEVYAYRFRNVFLGGVSVGSNDAALDSDTFKGRYIQAFPFFRAKGLCAGEALHLNGTGNSTGATNDTSIVLSADRPEAHVTLVPKPVDLDGARFHGLIFVDQNETEVYKGRKFVSDLGKFFPELPPQDLSYFYDPDVWGISFHASILNGDPKKEPFAFEYVDGAYCRVIEHLELPVLTESYGKQSEWRGFRPIVLTLRTTSEQDASIRQSGLFKGCRHLELLVPPSVQISLTLLPLFDPTLLTKNASHLCSSGELHESTLGDTGETVRLVPTISEVVIKITHAVQKPLLTPRLFPKANALSLTSAGRTALYVGNRGLDSKSVFFSGRIDLDAASTKEVRLQASWQDIQDNPRASKYSLQPGTAFATPRSILFDERPPAKPSAEIFGKVFMPAAGVPRSNSLATFAIGNATGEFVDQFGLQYSEDKVYLGEPAPEGADDKKVAINQFDVGDLKRKLLTVEALAVGRFSNLFSGDPSSSSLLSPAIMLDIPSTVAMTPPKVNHISHLRRTLRNTVGESGTRQSSFGLRIYLDRSYFESGCGERLAVGCLLGNADNTETKELRKDVTQWGEDPIERAGLQSTLRMPRASDFSAPPLPPGSTPKSLDSELYPDDGREGTAAVIYRDSVPLLQSSATVASKAISVASFALHFDDEQSLWYTDVYVEGDFFGWCGLALYRHQPHALDYRELSSTSTWAYASILYGEPVAWIESGGMLRITIGPVFDRSVSFELDPIEYRNGISDDLTNRDDRFHPLHAYQVGDAQYFEASVPAKQFNWNVLKKRFDAPVASIRIN